MPASLGSRFESLMDKHERRSLGVHYTSEANILRVLGPLLLDDLRTELEAACGSSIELERFLAKLARIRVLDPACGCGNFLIVAHRELRRIEDQALSALGGPSTPRISPDQFVGIEIDEDAATIARAELGSARILVDNALAIDWAALFEPDQIVFVVGNPPFVGKKEQTPAQKRDVQRVFLDQKGARTLDYVACWFMKAARLAVAHPSTSIAFVSTNSVTQGEQVGVLWSALFDLGIVINFAHRTFEWSSEATNEAAVHCVIIGFARSAAPCKTLFEYDTPKSEPHPRTVDFINAYLVDGPNVLLRNRSTPLGTGPKVRYGSFALDDGQYTLKPSERDELATACPAAERFIKPFVGGEELIHGKQRFCLWLVDATERDLEAMPEVARRVERVRKWRASRDRRETRALAETPQLFAEIRQPSTTYLAIPTLSSEHRTYIPIAFLEPTTIASNQIYVFEGATAYDFGILTSEAHMIWVRAVCGRLESRHRYSAGIAYNNFPWPEPNANQRTTIELRAQAVLDARAAHPSTSLAVLYDGHTMPPNLSKAHRDLDEAVHAAYGIAPGSTEAERAAMLFARQTRILRAADEP